MPIATLLVFFLFFSCSLADHSPSLNRCTGTPSLTCKHEWGIPFFLKFAPTAPLATWLDFFSFFFCSPLIPPLLSCVQGPHSLANTSGSTLYLKSVPTAHLATWCSFSSSYPFFSFSADPLPFCHRCNCWDPTHLRVQVGFPFSMDSHLLHPSAHECEVRCRSQLVHFLLLLSHLLTAPFLTWELPPTRPFIMCHPCRIAFTILHCPPLVIHFWLSTSD